MPTVLTLALFTSMRISFNKESNKLPSRVVSELRRCGASNDLQCQDSCSSKS